MSCEASFVWVQAISFAVVIARFISPRRSSSALSHVQARAARHLRIAFLAIFEHISSIVRAGLFPISFVSCPFTGIIRHVVCAFVSRQTDSIFYTKSIIQAKGREKAAPTKSRRLFIGSMLFVSSVSCVCLSIAHLLSSGFFHSAPKIFLQFFDFLLFFVSTEKKHNSFKRVRWYCEERPPVVWWKSRASIKRRFSIDEFVENGPTLPFRSSSLFTPKKLCSSFVCCSAFWDFCFSLLVFVTSHDDNHASMRSLNQTWFMMSWNIRRGEKSETSSFPTLTVLLLSSFHKQTRSQTMPNRWASHNTEKKNHKSKKPGGERCVWSIDRIHAINDLTILFESSEKSSLLNIDRVAQ